MASYGYMEDEEIAAVRITDPVWYEQEESVPEFDTSAEKLFKVLPPLHKRGG